MADTDMWEAERERFEAEIRKVNDDPKLIERWPGGAYKHLGVDGRWGGWKMACQASRPAEVDGEGQSDAKRLDWLESTNQTFCGNYSNTGFRAIGSSIWHGTLREAIDGAMIEAAPSHTTNKEK